MERKKGNKKQRKKGNKRRHRIKTDLPFIGHA